MDGRGYYWSIIIEPNWVQAGLWFIDTDGVKVLSVSASSAWGHEDELINATDSVLSSCVSYLPENAVEPENTVFGVANYWTTNGQISHEHLNKIKKICTELSLKPVGFVVVPDAISHYLKSKEGSPLSAILIGSSDTNFEISVCVNGEIKGYENVGRSVSVAEDLIEGLVRFNISSDNLPTRIILYDGKEELLDEVRQELLRHSWENEQLVKFLHTPKVEIITPEDKVVAVCLAGGSEIAGEVNVSRVYPKERENVPDQLAEDVVVEEEVKPIASDNFTMVTPQEMGFSNQQPAIVNTGIKEKRNNIFSGMASFFKKRKENLNKQRTVVHERIEPHVPAPLGAHLKPVRKIRINLSFFKIALLFVPIIFVGLFLVWWFVPKATVTIYVSPQKITDKVTIYVDPKIASTDLQRNILPGKKLSQNISGEKGMDTTGTKTVGDRAIGEVTIYHSGPSLKLNSGTILSTSKNLKFTLDETITVASGSASSMGTTKAKVTASDIGSSYNIAGGEILSVANYSREDLEAKSNNPFVGGSSKEVSAVSSNDQKKLEGDLIVELKQKASEKISDRVEEGSFFIKESLVADNVKREFSNKVGDEALSLNLKLDVDFSGIVVNKTVLSEIGLKLLKEKVPNGYSLKEDQLQITSNFKAIKDGVYELEVNYNANLLPRLNTTEVVNKIAGKYPEAASNYIKGVPGLSGLLVEITPPIFKVGRLGIIPRVKNNIQIEVTSKE